MMWDIGCQHRVQERAWNQGGCCTIQGESLEPGRLLYNPRREPGTREAAAQSNHYSTTPMQRLCWPSRVDPGMIYGLLVHYG